MFEIFLFQNSTTRFVLNINFLSGCFKSVEFPFNLTEDTSLSVAVEMVEQFGLTQDSRPIIAQLIDAFLVILIPEWTPCVTIRQVVSEGANGLTIEKR